MPCFEATKIRRAELRRYGHFKTKSIERKFIFKNFNFEIA